MEHRTKALVRDMIRIIVWGVMLMLMLWAILSAVDWGMDVLIEQSPIICSGSPDDCARWTP